MLQSSAAHGQMKFSWTANESDQELFFISLALTVDRKLLPVCGYLYASGRLKWIMRFQTVSLPFSERGLYSRDSELVCSLRVADLFFPFFVNILFKIILYTILLHCFSHFAFSWFVPPIVKVIIFPHEF